MFISSSVNALKTVARGSAYPQPELADIAGDMPLNNGAVPGTVKEIVLQPGKYSRYGEVKDGSRYITNYGATPSQLSLPPLNDGVHIEITVIKPIAGVQQSIVAAWARWNGVGGGIQYLLPQSIVDLRNLGYLIF